MQQGYDFIGSYDYSAFGNQLTSTNEDNPFRYCGEYYDNESGNIYLRNRYYNAPTGRFISEDPIKDGLNWYSYCGGNPVMSVDPLGLAAGDEFKTILEAAIDFDTEYITTSKYLRMEVGSLIYSYESSDGETVYSYAKPIIGEVHSVKLDEVAKDLPEGAIRVAGVHSHANSQQFSLDDMMWAQHPVLGVPLYMVNVENNALKLFASDLQMNLYGGAETYIGDDSSAKSGYNEYNIDVKTNIRGLSLSEEIALQYVYGSKWDEHMKEDCGFGCINKNWPNGPRDWNIKDSAFIKEWAAKTLSKRYK